MSTLMPALFQPAKNPEEIKKLFEQFGMPQQTDWSAGFDANTIQQLGVFDTHPNIVFVGDDPESLIEKYHELPSIASKVDQKEETK